MAWIESHQTLGNHPKLFKLAAILNCGRATAVGYLHYLWWWAIDYAPDGNVTRYVTDGDVLRNATHRYEDKSEESGNIMIDALVESGWLDMTEDGQFSIHDWATYSSRLVSMRKANAERQKRFRESKKKQPKQAAKVTRDVTLRNGATVHNTTQHNTTNKEDGAESPDDVSYFPEVKTEKYHPDTRTALFWLNEESGRPFREVDSNLTIISERLKETGVDIEGVKVMITRMVKRWKPDAKMREFLRPETLFCKSKFDGYYAARNEPVEEPGAPKICRSEGNLNKGMESEFEWAK